VDSSGTGYYNHSGGPEATFQAVSGQKTFDLHKIFFQGPESPPYPNVSHSYRWTPLIVAISSALSTVQRTSPRLFTEEDPGDLVCACPFSDLKGRYVDSQFSILPRRCVLVLARRIYSAFVPASAVDGYRQFPPQTVEDRLSPFCQPNLRFSPLPLTSTSTLEHLYEDCLHCVAAGDNDWEAVSVGKDVKREGTRISGIL
jgi:hypothetical protein